MILLFLLFASQAFAVDQRICGQWTPDWLETQYPDGDGFDANGDGITTNDTQDRLTTNAALPTHGLLAIAEWRVNSASGWQTLGVQYLILNGASAGCTELYPMPAGATEVRLTAYSAFSAGGHTLAVWDDNINEATGIIESPATTIPAGVSRVDVDLGSGDARFDAAIVMAWALERDDAGAASMTGLKIHACPRPANGSCLDPAAKGAVWFGGSNPRLFIGDNSKLTTMLHELGHAVTAFASPDPTTSAVSKTYAWQNIDISLNPPADTIFDFADSECPLTYNPANPLAGASKSHYLHSDEATSGAFYEAFATYFAAQVLNRVDEGDCFLQGDIDWNHDGSKLENLNSAWYSCETSPRPGLGGSATGTDYWEDQCEQYAPGPYPEVWSISSEYDWIRGFWDLDTDQGLTLTEITDVMMGAGPTTWLKSPTAAFGFSEIKLPANRLLQSATDLDTVDLFYFDAWDYECRNGICR